MFGSFRGFLLCLLIVFSAGGIAHAGEAQLQPAQDQPAAATPPAAETTPAPPPAPTLSPEDQTQAEEIRQPALNLMTSVEGLEKSVERNREDDTELARIRLEIEGLMGGADLTWDSLVPRLDALRRQIEKLGPAPTKDQAPEAQQVAAERFRLNALAAEVSGAIKTTELAQVRARQLYSEVQSLRQGIFTSQMMRRSPSPLSLHTWEQLTSELPGASRQIFSVMRWWLEKATGQWLELSGLIAAVFLLYVALKALISRFISYRLVAGREPPPAFFEQAATAGWVAPLRALPAGVAVALYAIGLDSLGLLFGDVEKITAAAVPALLIFVSVSALARAILQPRRPEWRLVNLATRPARAITNIITRLAGVYAADIVLQEVIRRLYLPLSINVVETAVVSIVTAALLFQLVRTPFEPKVIAVAAPEGGGAPAIEPQGHADAALPLLYPKLIKLPLLALAVAILGLSLLGYIGLGRFLASQVVVSGSAIVVVLLLHLAIRALLGGPGTGRKPVGQVLEERAGVTAAQSGAITYTLSAVLNVGLAVMAVPLILVTWGYSFQEALSWLRALIFGFEVGDFRISIARVLLAVLLFVALVLATRLIQRWLDAGVLKSKSLDQGIAHSIHTGVGYAGFLVAILVAVSYGGIDITNFAIVAGALSVGIGFGLQSIVNNFVSGLILLVERPIKVGDWVVVKGQQGYVRRIAVRSTEIETFDKASLIVPNSDLITSTVTNWTHRNALGRIAVKVGVAYGADPERVREILKQVGKENATIMQYPPPSVSLENFGASALEFSLSATVPDVNKAGGVQSELRFAILKAFREAGIEMPYQQHDVHLRDLDVVRHLVSKLAEERQARAASPVADEPRVREREAPED